MKKVVMHIIGGLGYGGAEKFLTNLIINFNNNNFKFIIVCYDGNSDEYKSVLLKKGATIEKISNPSNNYIKYIKDLRKIIKNYKPDILHCHTLYNACFPVIIGRLYKINRIIVHSHSTESNAIKENIIRKIYYSFSRYTINKYATDKVACGIDAGIFLFGSSENVKIINNGILIKDYVYDIADRQKIRNELGVDKNTVVFLHVGRFCIAKNHKYLINVYNKYLEKNRNSKLLLIGTGELENEIKDLVKKLNINDNVLFLGNKKNVNRYYNGSDCLIFPSVYEGIPLVLVEAQTNGIPILASDKIDRNVKFSNNLIFYDIDKSPNKWVDKLNKIIVTDKRESNTFNNPYSIDNVCKEVADLYLYEDTKK